MDGTFVKEIAERVAVPAQTAGGLTIIPHGWTLHDEQALIKPGPAVATLNVFSLGALRDYLKANRDTLQLNTLVAHVYSAEVVRVLGSIRERARDREMFVQANAHNLLDNFVGKWMPHEEFIIGLQTRFENAGDRTAVLQLASTMTHEAVSTSGDDGIGQTVTAKAGVALRATVPVPNPVTLRPFRTFREVAQPDSLFVLRVNQSMQIGLFEADGGAWRLTATERVRDWLKAELPDTIAVLA